MAQNASIDENSTHTLLGASVIDGTPVRVYADPSTHRLLVDNSGSATNFYTDTISGTINSSNKIFTVSNTITQALVLFLAGMPYQPIVDFTTSGTTITMVTAPDSSLSGQPFWIIHT